MPTHINYQIRRSRAGTLALAAALEAPAAALRRDLGGSWHIRERHGHCWLDPTGGYQCHVYSPSRWARCRRALAVMRMARAGTVEGFFAIDHLPGPVEASLIRAILGVDRASCQTGRKPVSRDAAAVAGGRCEVG